MRVDDIDRVIAAIHRGLKESITKITVIRLKLVIYWIKFQIRTNRPFYERGETVRHLSEVETNDFLPFREQKEHVDVDA